MLHPSDQVEDPSLDQVAEDKQFLFLRVVVSHLKHNDNNLQNLGAKHRKKNVY